MEKLKVLIEEKELDERINQIAQKISNDYKSEEEVVLLCVLKGAVYFAADLSKKITDIPVVLDFIKVSSYGNNTQSSGKVNLNLDLSTDIKGKNVIIIEDIIDSGYTLNFLYEYLKIKEPKTLKICVLLDKKERREKEIKVNYTGFEIDNKFIVGYGLDYENKYRNLPYIAYIE